MVDDGMDGAIRHCCAVVKSVFRLPLLASYLAMSRRRSIAEFIFRLPLVLIRQPETVCNPIFRLPLWLDKHFEIV